MWNLRYSSQKETGLGWVSGKACNFQHLCKTLSYGCTMIYLITLLLLDIWNIFNSYVYRAYWCGTLCVFVWILNDFLMTEREVSYQVQNYEHFQDSWYICLVTFQKFILPPTKDGSNMLPYLHHLWLSYLASSSLCHSPWPGYSFNFQFKSYFCWDIP